MVIIILYYIILYYNYTRSTSTLSHTFLLIFPLYEHHDVPTPIRVVQTVKKVKKRVVCFTFINIIQNENLKVMTDICATETTGRCSVTGRIDQGGSDVQLHTLSEDEFWKLQPGTLAVCQMPHLSHNYCKSDMQSKSMKSILLVGPVA